MAVVSMPEGADQARRAKVEATRAKFVAKVRAKYLIEIEPLCVPESLVAENGQLTGLILRRTAMANGRVVRTDETFEFNANMVVSSIGSIPQPIAGISMDGELYAFDPNDPGVLASRSNVFAVGNVLTGKGNIAVSRRHAIEISDTAIEAYLGVSDHPDTEADSDPHAGPTAVAGAASAMADELLLRAATQEPLSPETLAGIQRRVLERQKAVGYEGDLTAWIESSGTPC
jgi:hypothetical protein